MNLYQIYWTDGYEEGTGRVLSHEKKFTQKEFDNIVQESVRAEGGYRTILDDIENYMINHYGFEIMECMMSCT
jgi:hypothetical protein